MGLKLLFAALLVVELCVLPCVECQRGVCYGRTSTRRRSVTYSRGYYSTEYSCGWWSWSRCRRSHSIRNSRESYYTAYMSVRECCSGYRDVRGQCKPVCSSACYNGGTCVSPNTCSCARGWTGGSCSLGAEHSPACSKFLKWNNTACSHCNINECKNGQNNCGAIQYSICQNINGGYRCNCLFGTSTARPCTVPPNPLSPRNFRVSFLSSTSATVNWQVPVLQTNNGISGYKLVLREHKFGQPDVTKSVASNRLSYTFSGLQEFDSYEVQIKSVSVFTFESSPVTISMTTMEAAPASPPGSLSGSSHGSNSLSLSWRSVSPIDLNGRLNFYEIDITEVETGQQFQTTASSTNKTIVSLHPYYVYKCRVTAVTNARGPYTQYINIRTDESAPSAPPGNIQATATTTSITVTWVPPVSTYRNGIIRRYKLNLIENETMTHYEKEYTGTTAVIVGKHPFYTYHFNISAVTVAAGPYSMPNIIRLKEAAPTAAPQYVSGIAVDPTTISLEWSPPPKQHWNGIIRRYKISVLARESGSILEDSTTRLTATIQSLHPDYSYVCKVAAVTVAEGVYSRTIIVSTPISTPSAPPRNIDLTPQGPRALIISWNPPLLENRNGPIIGFIVNITDNIGAIQVHTTNTTIQQRSLYPYTTYRVFIAAITEAGAGPYSVATEIEMPEDVPSVPVHPSATTVIGNPYELAISWQPPLEPNGILTVYNIYCLSTLGYDMKVITVGARIDRSSLFPGLRPYTVYSCFVSCNTSVGEGNVSQSVSARTDESIPEDAPKQLAAFSNRSDTISLSWKEPTFPNGPIISYTVIHNKTDTDVTQVVADSTQLEITGLIPFTFYKVVIYASTRIGDGPSASITIQSAESNPGAPPQNIAVSVISSTNAVVSWLPPDPNKRNGIITHYRIVLTDEDFNVSGVIITVTGTQYTFKTLEEFVRYSLKITAATSAGLGPFSKRLNFTTFEATPSEPPQSVHGVFHSSTVIRFSWSPPPPLDVNGVIKYYVAEVTERYTGKLWTFFAVDSLVYIGSLHPYYLYDCTVAAHTIGTGPYSDTLTIQTDEEAPSVSPTILTASVTYHSIKVSVTPPPFENTNGLLRYYSMSVLETKTGEEYVVVSANTTNIMISGLHPYYTYICSVAAYTIRLGPYSDTITVTLEEAKPTGTPLNISGYSTGSESIHTMWDPPLSESQNGGIRYYIVLVTELKTGALRNHTAATAEINITSLHPYYSYAINIAAVTIGPGPFSTEIIIQTDEDVPTAPAGNITAVAVSYNSVELLWEPPPLEYQNGVIMGYNVTVKETKSGKIFTFIAQSPNLILENLKAHTTHEVTVTSYTLVGAGPRSRTLFVTTDETAPSSAPVNMTISDIKSTEFLLTWTAPPHETHNGIITEYVVNITEVETGDMYKLISQTASIIVQSLHPFYFYECAVSAVTVAEGPYTEAVTARTLEDAPDGYPKNVSVRNISSESVIVTWDPPHYSERNGVISRYDIKFTDAELEAISQIVSIYNYIEISSLTPFTTYFTFVSASTSVGMGPFGTSLSFTTLEDAPASAPTLLSSNASDSRTIYLSWSPPKSTYHNGIIREYHIDILEVETGMIFYHITSSTYITISSLHADYTYEWSVAAATVAVGPNSYTVSVKTPEDVPTGYPQNIKVTNVTTTTIHLQWNPPLTQEQNGKITGYKIKVQKIENNLNSTTFTTESSTVCITQLEAHTVYMIVIAATTLPGGGPYSSILTALTQEDAPDSHPTNLTGYPINSTHIFLDWDQPPEENVNGILRQYKINITEDITGKRFQFITGPYPTEIAVGPLHPDYTYHCTVVAYTVREGPHTSILPIRTKEDAPFSGPTNVTASALGSTTISISWLPPPVDERNGLIRAYLVVVRFTGGNNTFVLSADMHSTNISGLQAYTIYECSIHAITVSTGPPTRVRVKTDEDAPTSPPADINIEALNSTTFRLSWAPPAHINGIIRKYMINVTEVETNSQMKLVSLELNNTVQPLHPFYHYKCTLSAVTVAAGPSSNPIIIQLPEAAPSRSPTEVTVMATTSSSISFYWKSPPAYAINGIIRSYYLTLTEEDTGKHLHITAKSPPQMFQALHSFYSYTLQIAAFTIDVGPYSDPVTVTTLEDYPAGSPLNVNLKIRSSKSIQVNWEPPEIIKQNGIITSYVIQIMSPTERRNNIIISNATNADIFGLLPYTTYSVFVSAINSVGKGPFTSPLTVTTLEDAPVAAPESLAVTDVTSKSVKLSWLPPNKELTNGVIRNYVIEIRETNTGMNFSKTSVHLTHVVGDLHPYYTYHFSIYAVTVSTGPITPPLIATTLESIPTGSPQQVNATLLDSTSLELYWDAPPADEQNGNINHYRITAKAVDTGQIFEVKTTGDYTSQTIRFLHPFFTYQFIVAATTKVGKGPYSAMHKIQQPEDVPSSVPLGLTGDSLNSTAIFLEWKPPTHRKRNGLITSYTIRMQDAFTNNSKIYVHSSLHLIVPSLHPFYQYTFDVAANTSVGRGPFSTLITIRTQEDAPSAPPRDVEVTFVNSSSIRIRWTSPAVVNKNGLIRYYIIKFTSLSDNKTVNYNTNSANKEIIGLAAYKTYIFRIAAFTIAPGPFSAKIKLQTLQEAPSGPPQSVHIATVTPTSVTVKWTPPEPSKQNGEIFGYTIHIKPTPTDKNKYSTITIRVPQNKLNWTQQGLAIFTNYTVNIAAKTIAGIGPFSQAISFKTKETLPSPPSGVVITTYNSTIIKLKWDEPKRPNGIILGYQIEYKGFQTNSEKTSGPFVLTLDATERAVIIDNLFPGLTYEFNVTAKTSVGFGESRTVTVDVPSTEKGTQGKQLAPEEDIRYVIIICALGFLVILLVVAFTAWRIRRNILKKKREQKNLNQEIGRNTLQNSQWIQNEVYRAPESVVPAPLDSETENQCKHQEKEDSF